jgi:hypothetical protein
MQPAPPGASTCATCGGVLEETPGGGLGCMSCLLRTGIGSEEEVAQHSTQDAFEDGGASEFMRLIVGMTEVFTSLVAERWV